jgi:hypothetical protein
MLQINTNMWLSLDALPVAHRGTISLSIINNNIYAVADYIDDNLVYVKQGGVMNNSQWLPVTTTLKRQKEYDHFRSCAVFV